MSDAKRIRSSSSSSDKRVKNNPDQKGAEQLQAVKSFRIPKKKRTNDAESKIDSKEETVNDQTKESSKNRITENRETVDFKSGKRKTSFEPHPNESTPIKNQRTERGTFSQFKDERKREGSNSTTHRPRSYEGASTKPQAPAFSGDSEGQEIPDSKSLCPEDLSDTEPMDCDEYDPELANELKECRQSVSRTTLAPATLKGIPLDNNDCSTSNIDEKPLVIVVDTNIFITHLDQVRNLCQLEKHLKLCVPWSVLHELDSLSKNDKNCKVASRNAISFLQKELSSSRTKMFGQNGNQEQEAEKFFQAINADDRILQACLQQRSYGFEVVLLTNDRNLSTKAIVSQTQAYSSKKITQALTDATLKGRESFVNPSPKQQLVRESSSNPQSGVNTRERQNTDNWSLEKVLTEALEVIVSNEMELALDIHWKEIVLIKPKDKKPFWTLKQIFQIINKHWIAVFGLVKGIKTSDKKLFDSLYEVLKQRNFEQGTEKEKLSTVELSIKFLSNFKNRPYGVLLRPIVEKFQHFIGDEEIQTVFSEVWLEIYKIVTSNCVGLEVQYECELVPKINESLKYPIPPQNEILFFLESLNEIVRKLLSAFQSALKLGFASTLTLQSPELSNFHQIFTTVFSSIQKLKPSNYPPSSCNNDCNVSMEALQRYLTSTKNKYPLDFGYVQLVTISELALRCLRKQFEIISKN